MHGRRRSTIGLVALFTFLLLASPSPAGSQQRRPVVPPVETTHGPDSLALDPRGRVPAAPYAVDTALTPSWNKADYDGKGFTSDQTDPTTLPTVHALYVYPADKPSRFLDFAAMFQADARAASKFLGDLYGRGVRFDERGGSDGKVYLDITVFRSKHSSGRLGGNQQFSLVNQELLDRGFNVAGKKYVVWLDARSSYCGQGHLSHDATRAPTNGNEGRTLGIVYRPYDAAGADGGFCRGRTLLHELGHNLGALQKVAPNAFDGAHCDDDDNDVMCYTSDADHDSGSGQFDFGHNDYWDPFAVPNSGSTAKLSWWTTNLSSWVCPTTGCANINPGSSDY